MVPCLHGGNGTRLNVSLLTGMLIVIFPKLNVEIDKEKLSILFRSSLVMYASVPFGLKNINFV